MRPNDWPPDLPRAYADECALAQWEFREGQIAFLRGAPRVAPHLHQDNVFVEIWLSGWDAARKMRALSLELEREDARDDAARARAEIKLWRLRHPFAVIDGKKPGPASSHAKPGCSTQR